MKAKAIESSARLFAEESAMSFSLKDIASGSTREFRVDLSGLLSNPEPLLAALFFGAKTRLRNATAGQDFEAAVEAVSELASSINAGQWESRAREASEGRSSPLIRAIATIIYGGDVVRAQAQYDADIAQQAEAKGVSLDPDDEEGKAALRKLKADYRKELMKVPAIKKELLRLEAQQQMEAARRKLAAADAVQVPE